MCTSGNSKQYIILIYIITIISKITKIKSEREKL